MRSVRASLWLLIVLLVAALGLGAWTFMARGYPHVVYYQLVRAEPRSGPPVTTEEWIDASQCSIRSQVIAGSNPGRQLIRRGRLYSDANTRAAPVMPVSPEDTIHLTQLCAMLQHGGWPAVAAPLLASAVGTVASVSDNGRPALRFETTDHFLDGPFALQTMVWLDARTHQTLAYGTIFSNSAMFTRILRQDRLPPGSLPHGFFDAFTNREGLWDQLRGWVEDRLAGQ